MFGFFLISLAFPGEPAPAVVPSTAITITSKEAGIVSCSGQQRCGTACISWTEVCRDSLADSVGIRPPEVLPAGAVPANVPAGSSLLALPGLREAGRPTMDPGAPAFCHDGKTTTDVGIQLACVPYYSLGPTAATAPGTGAWAACPQHRRCGGECIEEGEVCPDGRAEKDSDRLSPFQP